MYLTGASEERVDCACGANDDDDGREMVSCERCGDWEHIECAGFRSPADLPDEYVCALCAAAASPPAKRAKVDGGRVKAE